MLLVILGHSLMNLHGNPFDDYVTFPPYTVRLQKALTELLLLSEADVVITSPDSSFSALAAGIGGPNVQRVGEARNASSVRFRSQPLRKLLRGFYATSLSRVIAGNSGVSSMFE